MIGNPQWFRLKAVSFGLIPVRWQGWAYSAASIGGIGFPFWLLNTRHQSLEALVWLVIATGAVAYDVWQMWAALTRPQKCGSAGASPSQASLARG